MQDLLFSGAWMKPSACKLGEVFAAVLGFKPFFL
jgi:hypothetical protein